MKTWQYVLIVLVLIVVCEFPYKTVFPFMSDDEYFIDKYGNIHGNNCPYKGVPWFTRKFSKYDLILLKDQEICRECLLPEEDKLNTLHEINMEEEALRLKIE